MTRQFGYTLAHLFWAFAIIITLFGSPAEAATIYVDLANCPGPGDGSEGNPFCEIQTAINTAVSGDTIFVADGVYTGTGNKNLDFGGKDITLRSASGDPSACIIDCQGSGRGFYFHSGETAAARVEALSVRNGLADDSSPGGPRGGGVYCYESQPTFVNCTIAENTAATSGGGVYSCGAQPVFSDCTIDGNTAPTGGGVDCEDSLDLPGNTRLNGCTIRGNTARGTRAQGGGVRCVDANATLAGCLIIGNRAEMTGSTSGQFGGGGVYYRSWENPTITNCIIVGNSAVGTATAYGGGVFSGSWTTITNCTISGNTASASGGGVYSQFSNFTETQILTNSIVWENAPEQIYTQPGNVPSVTYCDVQGGFTGTGNIDVDPGFALSGDFHLMPDSPCIDAGTNSPTGGLPAQDADGNPRSLDGNGDGQAVTDMGAYEFNPAAPAIAASPNQIIFYLPEGQVGPEPKTLSIRNAGGGELNWSLAWAASWLQADPLQGDSAGEIDLVTLTADASELDFGSYSTTLAVIDPQATNTPRIVQVILNVTRTLTVPGQYSTIQEAINAAIPGDEVLVEAGTYTGSGNKNLDYHGKPITVRSASGDPAMCIIDCQGSGRGLFFHSGETAAAVLQGFTVCNGYTTSSSPSGPEGCGICCTNNSSPTLVNCIISGNTAVYSGGGIACLILSSPNITNCLVSGNSGGGIVCKSSSAPVITGCTISGNTSGYGGGVLCGGSSAHFSNCMIHGNTASVGGGVMCSGSPSATLRNCTITENAADWTGSAEGGGVMCQDSSPVLIGCTISKNTARSSSSYATAAGGGVSFDGSGALLVCCLISDNSATGVHIAHGGGAACFYGSVQLVNCTFTANWSLGSDSSSGGGVYVYGNVMLKNCVLWGDTPQEIYRNYFGTLVVQYCDVQGGYTGTGNIDLDPHFVDPDGADNDPATWQDNDFRLEPGSSCIDAGKNSSVPSDTTDLDGDGDATEPTPFDLDGLSRFVDDPASPDCPYVPETCGTAPIVDMGAFEYQPPVPGDLDGDDDLDGADFALFLASYGRCTGEPEYNPAADLNGDGCVTLADYQLWLQLYREFHGDTIAPPPLPSDLGDMDRDGVVNGVDIQPFVDVLLKPDAATLRERFVTDFTGDGQSDAADVAGFVEKLVGE